jgi:K+ potassium transporter
VARWLATLGIFGASLFLADGMITPAISVLSAVEGLQVVQPELEPLIIPITVVIIVLLFAVQRTGTKSLVDFPGCVALRSWECWRPELRHGQPHRFGPAAVRAGSPLAGAPSCMRELIPSMVETVPIAPAANDLHPSQPLAIKQVSASELGA